jgi:photoactive yellow protein
MDFDTPRLAQAIERLTVDEVDALPYGAIRLDAEGRVTFYSKAEARLSGYGSRPSIGKVFFSEIAPCMDNDGFLGRIEAARRQGALDLEFGWIGDFEDRDRALRVRVQSSSDGGVWVFISRDA